MATQEIQTLLAEISQPKQLGRPRVYLEIRKLVRTMAAANPIWERRASMVSW
jgi:hypothetical protein